MRNYFCIEIRRLTHVKDPTTAERKNIVAFAILNARTRSELEGWWVSTTMSLMAFPLESYPGVFSEGENRRDGRIKCVCQSSSAADRLLIIKDAC